MNILGVTLGHDTSFALVRDGELVGILEAERYFRQKRYKLSCINLEPGKHISGYQYVDVEELKSYIGLVSDTWGLEYDAVAVQNQGRRDEYNNLLVLLKEAGFVFKRSFHVDHHLSHAAMAFYTSPFSEAVVLSYDGLGNDGYTIVFEASGGDGLKYLERNVVEFGRNYSNLGYIIGIQPEICGTTSGKVMGLAAYGDMREDWMSYAMRYVREYRKLPAKRVDGLNNFGKGHRINSVALDEIPDLLSFVSLGERVEPGSILGRLTAAFRSNPKQLRMPGPDNKLGQSLVRTIQAAWSQEVLELLKRHAGISRNLCVVGGCALNGITNYIVQETGLFENFHFIPNPSDCGLSSGAALYVYHAVSGKKFEGYGKYLTPYLGVEAFDLAEISTFKKKYPNAGVSEEQIPSVLAKLIASDRIVGVIRGRYENGPRALGNRSILCNPINRNMKDIINSKVKHREWYRPFAPVVTAAEASKYFTNACDIPYMSVICYTRPEYRDVLPSITHVDGSARLQTVRREQNQYIYDTLKEFEKITGYPIILNTSFNPKGEPILNFCRVGLEMLDNTDMDMVLVGNTFFCKKGREVLLQF
ncbi:MAG: carbamoyltransferase C-terminal domain-containing protein [Syntrophales bacterium]